MKYIKAKRCYICGQLHDIKDGGYIIAKKYFKDIFCNDAITKITICQLCTEKMNEYIIKERNKDESSNNYNNNM